MKTAIEAEDPQQLKNVLEKYAVDYLVLDYSLIPVSSPVKGLQYDRLEEVLGSTQGVEQVKQLKDIRVYKVNHEYTAKSFVAIAESVPNIGPTVKRMSDDTAYANNKTYISTDTLPYNAYYPFLDFMTQSRQPQQNWTVTKSDQFISVSTPRAAALLDDADLYSIQTGTSSAVFHIIRDGKERQITVPVTVESKNGTVSLHFPDYKATTLNPSAVNVLSCGKSAGPITVKKIGSILQVRTNNNVWGCFTYLVGQVEQQYGYLLSVSSKNSAGKRLFFYILDRTKSQNYIEDLIQDNETYYVISPKYQYGVGYTFSFQNTSYTNTPSENTLLKMDLSYLPYSQIKNVVITEKNPNIPQARYVNAFQAKKRSYFHYEVNPGEISPGAVVLLNQTYDSGWKAYKHSSKDIFAAVFPFVGGKEVTTHVPVNNWANGWILDKDSIDPSSTIHLVFLPQYLEFAGMLIVTMLGFGLLYRAKNNN